MVSTAVDLECKGRIEMSDIKISNFERHLQAAVSIVGIGLLTWAGLTLNQLQQDAAAMAVEVKYITAEMQVIKQQTNEVYSQSQAARDWAKNEIELNKIRDRIRDLELQK